jgi:tRNA (cytosine49-C5)-methyltransferase
MNDDGSIPGGFLEKLRQLVPPDRFDSIVSAYRTLRLTTLRANTLKIRVSELDGILNSYGFRYSKVSWIPEAYIMENVRVRQLSEIQEYRDGKFYIQSLSSMVPALILDPNEGDAVLDIAAAPGSKTTQLAAMMNNGGSIIATDSSPIRILRLKANIQTQGVTNTRCQRMDGRSVWQKYPEYFDKSLVDAPCSMEGTFSTHHPNIGRQWAPGKVKMLSEQQKWLLRSAISATKPGGTIVYSTCTISPEENELVVDWILRKEKGNVELEPIATNGIPLQEAFDKWKNHTYAESVRRCVRIYPDTLYEGFFIAKFKKLRSNVPTGFIGLG